VINGGKATGNIVGGNLCSINLLQGTEYMPDIKDKILFIEDDSMSTLESLAETGSLLCMYRISKRLKGCIRQIPEENQDDQEEVGRAD